MGIDRLTAVTEALRKAGIRTRRGFPVGKMPYLTEPVAAVGPEQAQLDSVMVKVWIYSPMVLGGEKCEDTAMLAAQTLVRMGARYEMMGCEFDGKMGLYHVLLKSKFM